MTREIQKTNTVNERPMKDGYYLDSYVSTGCGETFYRVCDDVGEVQVSIFLNKLERFFGDSPLQAPVPNQTKAVL
jgi:hypothetical protein